MDVQQFIAVNVMAISAIVIVMTLTAPRILDRAPWIAVNGLVLATGLAALEWWPRWAGVVVLAVFVPLVLAPRLAAALAVREARHDKQVNAARLMRVAAMLHPSAEHRFAADVMQAEAAPYKAARIAGLLALCRRAPPSWQALLRALACRLDNDWPKVLDALRQGPVAGGVAAPSGSAGQSLAHSTDPIAAQAKALEIRALGETGRIDEMVRVHAEAMPGLSPIIRSQAELAVLVFCGRVAAVEALFLRALAGWDAETRRYWMAVASLAAATLADGPGGPSGQDSRQGPDSEAETAAQARLREIALTAIDGRTREAASRQLANWHRRESERLSGFSSAVVDRIEARLASEIAHSPPPTRPGPGWAPVTYGLVALNIAMFMLEIMSGGSESARTLTSLGALWPPAVLEEGEWWRLGTSAFLHFGTLHLCINMLVLLTLGRTVEAEAGHLPMALTYIVGGLASAGFVLWLMATGLSKPALLVGASGAIFALFGAISAARVATWLRTREVQDGREVMLLCLLLVVSVVIDLSQPQVSLSAHASGFVAGLIVAPLLMMCFPRRV